MDQDVQNKISTFAPQTNILQLPEAMLYKIMNLAGLDDNNSNIRLVCKQFYKVYCKFTSCGLTFDSGNVSLKY